MVSHLDNRLDHLRRPDDVLGGAQLRRAALAECDLAQRLAADTTYDAAVACRLYSTISEAARICGWQHFDAGASTLSVAWGQPVWRRRDSSSDTSG